MTSSKPIAKLRNITPKEVYAAYAKKLLEQNPTWFGRYDRLKGVSNGLIYSGDPKDLRQAKLEMSWSLWFDVVAGFYHRAKYAIIQGDTLMMGRLGKIRGARIERSFQTPAVDWRATRRLNEHDENGELVKVYHTSDDYCRIEFVNYEQIANAKLYIFKPAEKNTASGTGFKIEFSKALVKDPLLKFRFKFKPIISKKAPDAI